MLGWFELYGRVLLAEHGLYAQMISSSGLVIKDQDTWGMHSSRYWFGR